MEGKMLEAYGLDALLIEVDDAQLWEAALTACWPWVDDPALMVETLRFLIGRAPDSGETIQGEENNATFTKYGLVEVEEWCFERVDAGHMKVCKRLEAAAPAAPFSPGFGMPGISSGLMNFQSTPARIVMMMGVSRPSLNSPQAVVFCGSSMPGAAEGKAELWRQTADHVWQPSGQIVARWLS
jgi:hypothetical protein